MSPCQGSTCAQLQGSATGAGSCTVQPETPVRPPEVGVYGPKEACVEDQAEDLPQGNAAASSRVQLVSWCARVSTSPPCGERQTPHHIVAA
jgi:hypothetical protein